MGSSGCNAHDPTSSKAGTSHFALSTATERSTEEEEEVVEEERRRR